MKVKLIRITTVPISLKILLKDQLRFMNQYFETIGISSEGKELLEVKHDEGIKTIAVNMSREITPLKDFLSLLKMIRLLHKEKPTIVHTHTPKAGIIGMLASWIVRVPHRLHTVAGLPVMEAKGKKKLLLLKVEQLTYFCATKVYANSYGLKKYILDNHLTHKNKLKVIGHGSSNGIDTLYFDKTPHIIKESKKIKLQYHLDNQFIFCFIGRIVKDKGVNELLYAFNKLSLSFNNIKLFILGSFEKTLDPISTQSYQILQNNKDIINLGFQNDIRPYLATSDCFVLPSYREGFPNVVLQASSMGISSIVSNINGCNEIIKDNENGLIIQAKDQEGLYEAMKKYLEDKELSKKLSLHSREEILQKYDRKEFYHSLLKEYNEVLSHD